MDIHKNTRLTSLRREEKALAAIEGRLSKAELDRETLKPPFYSQCYVAAPFASGFNSGMNIARSGHPEWVVAGTAITLLSLFWYVVVEVCWFRQDLRIGTLLALWFVARTVVEAMCCFSWQRLPLPIRLAPDTADRHLRPVAGRHFRVRTLTEDSGGAARDGR